MIYNELRGNLITYEKNHINRYSKEENMKIVACNAITTGEEESINENNSEGMTHKSRSKENSKTKAAKTTKLQE